MRFYSLIKLPKRARTSTIVGSRESRPFYVLEEVRQTIVSDKKAREDLMAGESSGAVQPASSSASSSKSRDACISPYLSFAPTLSHLLICGAKLTTVSELMSTKRKAPEPPPSKSKRPNNSSSFNRKDGLGQYILNPKKYPPSTVLYYDDNFVAINDLYPKSSAHCLLLPRSEKYTHQHPFDAFEDAEFLAVVRAEAAKLKTLVAKELQRKYGPVSKQDEAREAVLNGEFDADELPIGRDWEKEVKVGVHAHPSMNHLHIHVISVDRHSVCLKHRKHYNSFATAFFVDLEDFPLAEDDVRRKESYLHDDMKCWRCGKNFENRFQRLKEHLVTEFEEWKKE